MLLPNKYVNFNNSLICLSACILQALGNSEISIDKLWKKVSIRFEKIDFNKFIRTLLFMRICSFITLNEEGRIRNESIRNKV